MFGKPRGKEVAGADKPYRRGIVADQSGRSRSVRRPHRPREDTDYWTYVGDCVP